MTYYIIPDEIIITFSILFLIVEFLAGGIKNVGMHLLTGILLFIIMYLIMLLGEKLFKKESLGGGDVKLLFLFGLVLDPLLGIFTIFLGSLIALPISIFILYKEKNNMIPFGPFLLLAFMLIYYSGITSEQIINLEKILREFCFTLFLIYCNISVGERDEEYNNITSRYIYCSK